MRIRDSLAVLIVLLIPTLSFAASQPPPTGYTTGQLLSEDTFTSTTLNTGFWNPWLGDDQWGRWNDQGNLPSPYSGSNCNSTCSNSDQIMYYDPYPYGYGTGTNGNHLVGGGGSLALIAYASTHYSNLGYTFASGAVTSYGKKYLPATGGYVQIHAKMPDSRYGAWAGLWLLSLGGAELDIIESGYPSGSTPPNQVMATNWHGGGSQMMLNTGVDLSAAYHTYGVEYRPGQSWKIYLDGKLMATYTQSVPSSAYQILIDLEIAGPNTNGWHTLSDTVNHPGPFELDVDDVQIYSLTAAVDTTPPSVPTNLTAKTPSPTEVDLSWTASTDNVAVTGYKISRNGTQIGTSTGTTYADKTAVASTTYNYTVTANDAAGNVSTASTAVNATTPAPAPPPVNCTVTVPITTVTVGGTAAALTGSVTCK